ncbi:MAG: DNA polymerase IV [Steroidobacteraceae bacterium]|jgi:DNA polymerase-4|nr:DNA polymerase IV [Steroidobacteraceae bacterium]
MSAPRAILHVDMDAFYASVEMHDRPELRGLPVIVGGTSGRGVVAAASYEVRRYGVHSAMPVREALARCPHAVCVKPRMERYKEVSQSVFEVFHEFTPLVEGLSLDEAYLDVTGSRRLHGEPAVIAAAIKARIRERTGLTASVGAAHNKLLAKIASDLKKPDGLCTIAPDEVARVLDPLPIRRLHGIGPKTATRLEECGLHTLGQLRAAPDAVLWPLFGKHTQNVRDRAAGIDERPVEADWQEKQVSAEETFDVDLKRAADMHAELAKLADRVGVRLRAKELTASTVVVKIRRRDFATYTRSRSFAPATQDTGAVLKIARELLDGWLAEQPRAAVRLLGVGLASLAPAVQLDLFGQPAGDAPTPRSEATAAPAGLPPAAGRAGAKLDPTLDRIREKFGDASVTRASSLGRGGPKEDGFTGVRRRS